MQTERLIFHNLEDNSIVITIRDHAALEEAEGRVRTAAEGIAARKFPAKSGYHCTLCPYRNLCPATEKVLVPQKKSATRAN